jgi:hypothetical protein
MLWMAVNRKADAMVHMTQTEYRNVINFLADGGGSRIISPVPLRFVVRASLKIYNNAQTYIEIIRINA